MSQFIIDLFLCIIEIVMIVRKIGGLIRELLQRIGHAAEADDGKSIREAVPPIGCCRSGIT